jgi:hypothetical protein
MRIILICAYAGARGQTGTVLACVAVHHGIPHYEMRYHNAKRVAHPGTMGVRYKPIPQFGSRGEAAGRGPQKAQVCIISKFFFIFCKTY